MMLDVCAAACCSMAANIEKVKVWYIVNRTLFIYKRVGPLMAIFNFS